MANRPIYSEPVREIPMLGEYDAVFCGGGPAGCAAAIGAARHGARTLLIEKDGYLGGATVSQLVCVILSTNGVDFQGIWHDYARELRRRGGLRELRDSSAAVKVPTTPPSIPAALSTAASILRPSNTFGTIC